MPGYYPVLLSSVLPHFPSSPTALLGELQMKLSTRPHSHRQSVKDRHTPQTAGDHLSPKNQNYSVCFLSPHPRGRGETNNTTMKQYPKADLGNSQLYRTAKLLELAPVPFSTSSRATAHKLLLCLQGNHYLSISFLLAHVLYVTVAPSF